MTHDEIDKLVKKMTFKEFKNFCTERACDGQWGFMEALIYSSIVIDINKIKVKYLGFIPSRKKTEKAREEAWQKVKNGDYSVLNKER